MAFNINIPGPKLIDLDLSTKLGDLGTTFRQNRDEAYAKDIFANLDLNDPAQVDRAVTQLAHLPQYAGLAQRIAESHQRAQERLATEDIARRGVAVREGELGRGLAADRAAREQDEAFQRALQNRPALPPATADDAPTISSTTGIRPSSESQPTTQIPGNRAVQERFPTGGRTGDWWDIDAQAPEPATPTTLGPRSSLQDTLGGGVSTGTLLGETGQDVLRGPTGPVAPAPEGPRLRPAGAREKALDAEIEYLSNVVAAAPDSARANAIKVRLQILDNERKDLRKRREDLLARQEQSILKREERAAAIEEEPKKELGKKLVAETRSLDAQDTVLREIGAIARTPNYTGGTIGRLAAVDAAVIPQILPESMRPGFVQSFVDKGTLVRRVDTLNKALTKAESGEKGLGTQGFTDKDRDFVGAINPSVDDPQQVLRLKAEAGLAVTDRRRKIVQIVREGLSQGKTVAEIDDGIAKYAEKYPLFVTRDGKLTELGRKVNPALARSMESETAAPSGDRGAATGFTGRTAINKETGQRLRETTDGKWVP